MKFNYVATDRQPSTSRWCLRDEGRRRRVTHEKTGGHPSRHFRATPTHSAYLDVCGSTRGRGRERAPESLIPRARSLILDVVDGAVFFCVQQHPPPDPTWPTHLPALRTWQPGTGRYVFACKYSIPVGNTNSGTLHTERKPTPGEVCYCVSGTTRLGTGQRNFKTVAESTSRWLVPSSQFKLHSDQIQIFKIKVSSNRCLNNLCNNIYPDPDIIFIKNNFFRLKKQ